jgi:hypothetical protein
MSQYQHGYSGYYEQPNNNNTAPQHSQSQSQAHGPPQYAAYTPSNPSLDSQNTLRRVPSYIAGDDSTYFDDQQPQDYDTADTRPQYGSPARTPSNVSTVNQYNYAQNGQNNLGSRHTLILVVLRPIAHPPCRATSSRTSPRSRQIRSSISIKAGHIHNRSQQRAHTILRPMHTTLPRLSLISHTLPLPTSRPTPPTHHLTFRDILRQPPLRDIPLLPIRMRHPHLTIHLRSLLEHQTTPMAVGILLFPRNSIRPSWQTLAAPTHPRTLHSLHPLRIQLLLPRDSNLTPRSLLPTSKEPRTRRTQPCRLTNEMNPLRLQRTALTASRTSIN